jgi:hypothetical protein
MMIMLVGMCDILFTDTVKERKKGALWLNSMTPPPPP